MAPEEGLRAYMAECKKPSNPNPNNKAKGVLMEDCNMWQSSWPLISQCISLPLTIRHGRSLPVVNTKCSWKPKQNHRAMQCWRRRLKSHTTVVPEGHCTEHLLKYYLHKNIRYINRQGWVDEAVFSHALSHHQVHSN